MLRAFFGRHKSASTWVRNILHEAAWALDMKILTIHVEEQWAAYPTLGDMVRAENPDILIMTKPLQKDVDTLPEFRGMHLIRDPRDIVVSGYFSHRNSHPEVFGGIVWHELVEHRKHLRAVDKDAGMAAEIEWSGPIGLDPMMSWNYDNPAVLELKMEDVTADPQRYWTQIFTHYDMLGTDGPGKLAAVTWNVADRREAPRAAATLRKVLPRVPMRKLPPAYLPNVLERYSFTNLSNSDRKPGEVDENSHYRKGMARDWENHLNAQHLELFRARYGDLVERLGYEW